MKKLSFLKQYYPPLIAFFFSIWGLVLRFQTLASRELTGDEYTIIIYARKGFLPSLKRINYTEQVNFPGLYLTTWPVFQMFGENKWGLMLPHILATIIGFCILYLICKRYFKTPFGYLACFALVCFNPELIFHSFELRHYAVLPTLALALFYVGETLIDQTDQLKLHHYLIITLLFLITLIYHLYGIIMIFFIMMYFFVRAATKESLKTVFKRIWPYGTFIAVMSLAIVYWYALSPSQATTSTWGLATFEFIPNPLVNPIGFLKGIFCNLTGHKMLYVLFLGIILALLIAQKNRREQIGFFLWLVLAPIGLILLMDVIKGYWFVPRQFIWITPLFAFFIGWCWDSVINFLFLQQRDL